MRGMRLMKGEKIGFGNLRQKGGNNDYSDYLNNRSFHRAFIGFILAAVLAMGKYSDESANKSFADWLKLGVYLDERHFGLRHS